MNSAFTIPVVPIKLADVVNDIMIGKRDAQSVLDMMPTQTHQVREMLLVDLAILKKMGGEANRDKIARIESFITESLDDFESKHELQQASQLGEKAEEMAEVKLDDGSVTVAHDKPRSVRASMVFNSDYIVEPESLASALAASNLGLPNVATLPLPIELDATPQALQVPATISTSKTEELLLTEVARASGELDFRRHADTINTTLESNMMKPANLVSPFTAQMPTAEEFKAVEASRDPAAEAQFSFTATSSNSIPLQVQWNQRQVKIKNLEASIAALNTSIAQRLSPETRSMATPMLAELIDSPSDIMKDGGTTRIGRASNICQVSFITPKPDFRVEDALDEHASDAASESSFMSASSAGGSDEVEPRDRSPSVKVTKPASKVDTVRLAATNEENASKQAVLARGSHGTRFQKFCVLFIGVWLLYSGWQRWNEVIAGLADKQLIDHPCTSFNIFQNVMDWLGKRW
ncbi:hypothetical protein LZ554_002746 [Drepanopeziza brunnea f. sp. 'monogermtubi']|nr:hypothetical protein LZ554_002746 [Drepanopeziza brunnea f. sp. 'monogermtubi']